MALAASNGIARGVSMTLRSARGKLLARTTGMTISRRRTVVLRLAAPLGRGSYTLSARGKDGSRRELTATRRIVLR